MRTVTLATLETRTKQRANVEYGSSASLFTPAELDSNINEGIAEFWNIVAEFPDQHWYLNSTTFTTSAQNDTYPIGPGQLINVQDFYKPGGVDVQFGQNIVNTAKRFMWSERNRFKILYSGWVYTQPVFYALVGNSSGAPGNYPAMKFIPMPSGSFSITIWYLPVAPMLVNGTDVFDGINGYEEYAVLSAAEKLLTKQERFEHASVLAGKRAEMASTIRSILGARDNEMPERVTDVTLNDDGWLGRPVY